MILRLKENLLFVFIAVTILYYFLRFQWGFNLGIVGLQFMLLTLISTVALLRLITSNSVHQHPPFFFIFIMYSAILLVPTLFRGGVFGVVYSIKDYLAPALLLLGYSYFIRTDKIYSVFYCLSLVGLSVSVIYFAEFIYKNILFLGTFNYTEGIRDLSLDTGADYLAESSFSDGVSDFFRLVGPLSHNNSTATIIAVGILATIPMLVSRFRSLALLILAFCTIVLLVTGSRTAYVAIFVSLIFYFRDRWLLLIGLFLTIVIFFLSISFFVPAFIEVLNIETLLKTVEVIFSQVERLGYDRFYNLLIGSGYNFPGFDNSYAAFNGPVLNDDLFIIQLITTYGFLPLLLFLYYVFSMPSIPKEDSNYLLFNTANSILICLLITTVHTNALIRPQIFPVFFLIIVLKHLIFSHYQIDKNSQSIGDLKK